jgi:hypothetical protein
VKSTPTTLKRVHKSACFTELLADSISKNVMAFAESVGPDFVDGLLQTGQCVVKLNYKESDHENRHDQR